jgi:hypothetical protein
MINTNIFQEEDLGFDPWGESTRALQDLMQIEKTSNEIKTDDLNNLLYNNQVNNMQNIFSLANCNTNNLASNKTLMNHIEFLQKNFQQQHNHSDSSAKSKLDCRSSSNDNELSGTDLQFKSFNNETNENFRNTDYQVNLLKLNSLNNNNDTFQNDLTKKNTFPSSSLSPSSLNANLSSYNVSIKPNSSSYNGVVPPPGFNLNNTTNNNVATVNQNYLTPSSSIGSSSSSNSSSVNNSASSTPALNQANPLLQLKSVSVTNQAPHNESNVLYFCILKVKYECVQI